MKGVLKIGLEVFFRVVLPVDDVHVVATLIVNAKRVFEEGNLMNDGDERLNLLFRFHD